MASKQIEICSILLVIEWEMDKNKFSLRQKKNLFHIESDFDGWVGGKWKLQIVLMVV